MGKKENKERASNHAPIANGDDSGSHGKRPKKKRKNTDKAEEPAEATVSLANESPTVSIALPGSIINNAQSLELATRLAGQVARAATIFRIDEVVVFDNKSLLEDASTEMMENDLSENETGAFFLMRILRYLETPQYLRKSLFPKHNSLRFVQVPHFLSFQSYLHFLGVTLDKIDRDAAGTFVDVGLSKNVTVDQVLEPGRRVTVEMGTDRNLDSGPLRKIVPSSQPRENGMYWGYKVRYAPNISSMLKNCPYKGGYDYRIGTSEHGTVINSSELALPSFRHLLIAFGGLAGLEECVEEDNKLKDKTVRDIFDLYLNTCPRQGSRTIRTEEAIFISLQYFQEPINKYKQP